MFNTVGNYEYGFFYYFYQDGSIEVEVKHTGIVNTSTEIDPRYSTAIGTSGNIYYIKIKITNIYIYKRYFTCSNASTFL